MLVQFYSGEGHAAIFHHHKMVAKLPDCDSRLETDIRLRKLGWRRRGKWKRTEWGSEAKLRKKTL